jgi:hypothetical protein
LFSGKCVPTGWLFLQQGFFYRSCGEPFGATLFYRFVVVVPLAGPEPVFTQEGQDERKHGSFLASKASKIVTFPYPEERCC